VRSAILGNAGHAERRPGGRRGHRARRGGHAGWCAEILRANAAVMLKQGALDAAAAETRFRRSLDIAHQQGSLSWELRAATSLARLWRDQGRVCDAHDLLASVYARFTEGCGTADLVTARALLHELVS
jgi:predicted ATPase